MHTPIYSFKADLRNEMKIWGIFHALPSQILKESEHGVRANWHSSTLNSPTSSENSWTMGFHCEQALEVFVFLAKNCKCEHVHTYIKLRILEVQYQKFVSELYRPFASVFREK